jgi:hypothetical protein
VVALVDRVNTVADFHDPRKSFYPTKKRQGGMAHPLQDLPIQYFKGADSGRPKRRAWTTDPHVYNLLRSASAKLSQTNPKPDACKKKHGAGNGAILSSAMAWLCNPSKSGVVVMRADKGGAMVVWCLDSYIRCGLDHLLGDPTIDVGTASEMYRFLPGGLQEAVALNDSALLDRSRLVAQLVQEGCLSERGGSWVTTFKSNTTPANPIRFHPKLTGVSPSSLTFRARPIVSTVSSVTRTLDKYLSVLTKELLAKIPFTCGSTKELLCRIRALNDHCHDNSWQLTGLHTADVVGLYPSVRWEPGVRASLVIYERWRGFVQQRINQSDKYRDQRRRPLNTPSPQLFESLLRFVLANNVIVFPEADMYFVQCSGVAMGSCVSAFVAGCYLWSCMRSVLNENPRLYGGLLWPQYNSSSGGGLVSDVPPYVTVTPDNGGHESGNRETRIVFLVRYVDDFLCATALVNGDNATPFTTSSIRQGVLAFDDFVSRMRHHSPDGNSLAFTTHHHDFEQESLTKFLDCQLRIIAHPLSGRRIVSSSKPVPVPVPPAFVVTSRPLLEAGTKHGPTAYIPYQSCHPPTVLAAVPVAQMTRLARNCTAGVHFEGPGRVQSAFLRHARVLTRWLRLRGYPGGVIKRAVCVALKRLRSGNLYSNPETGRAHHISGANMPLLKKRHVFAISVQYRGQSRHHFAQVQRMLNAALASAATFYSRQGPGGQTLSDLFASSRATVCLRVRRGGRGGGGGGRSSSSH